jgi:integrase
MATTKVGIYRNYYGPVPTDVSGSPLPKSEWPQRRAHSWVVRWHGTDGQRYSRSFEIRKEAERFAEEKQNEVRDGQANEPEKLTLMEFCKMYLSVRADLTERYRQEYERTLRVLRKRLGDNRSVQSITPLDARQYLAWFRTHNGKDNPLSPNTVNKMLRECRRFFREGVDCGVIKLNPFDGIRQQRVAQTPWHHVTPTEFQRLLAAAPSDRWRGKLTLAYCCGLRLGEILNLTWSDVDFAGQTVRVVAKRGKDVVDWTPKDKDMRLIPLPRTAAEALTKLKTASATDQRYVFVNGKGPNVGGRMPRNNSWRDFNAIRLRAGLPECSMHDLRKSFCTNLARSMPMHVVQELAGHSDIRTTRRFYLKLEPELMDEARLAVERALAC